MGIKKTTASDGPSLQQATSGAEVSPTETKVANHVDMGKSTAVSIHRLSPFIIVECCRSRLAAAEAAAAAAKQVDGRAVVKIDFDSKCQPPLVTAFTKPGDNFASRMLHVEAQVVVSRQTSSKSDSDADADVDVVDSRETFEFLAKEVPSNAMVERLIKESAIHEREVIVYTKILPKINDLADKIVGRRLNVPPIFHADETVICMKNMKPDGYAMNDKKKGLDEKSLMVALDDIALLHASSYFHITVDCGGVDRFRQQFPAMFFPCWMPQITDRGQNLNEIESISYMATMIKIAVEIVSKVDTSQSDSDRDGGGVRMSLKRRDELVKKLEWLLEDERWQAKLFHSFDDSDVDSVGSFLTLTHNDYWINNQLFNIDDPIGHCIVDWQLVRYGHPAVDLAYLMASSSDPKLRTMSSSVGDIDRGTDGYIVFDHQKWLDFYYSKLEMHFDAFGQNFQDSNPSSSSSSFATVPKLEALMTRDQLEAGYRRAYAFGMMVGLCHAQMAFANMDGLDFASMSNFETATKEEMMAFMQKWFARMIESGLNSKSVQQRLLQLTVEGEQFGVFR